MLNKDKFENEYKGLNSETELIDFEEDDDEEEIEEDKASRSTMSRIVALLMLISFLALAYPVAAWLDFQVPDILQRDPALDQSALVLKSRPAIVSVEVQISAGGTPAYRRGTGFCIGPNGPIITNTHVVEDSNLVKVVFEDGTAILSQSYQALKGADLAVIMVRGENLPYLNPDYESVVANGEKVTVIGNPLGYDRIAFEGTVGQYHIQSGEMRVFDISIAAHPGSSGSPVLNEKGKVVGTVYASTQLEEQGETTNRALAIPIGPLKSQIEALLLDNPTISL